jgi:translation elongation factor EF-Ts
MAPPYAVPDDVPQDVLEKEKKFLTEQALESGKPLEIAEKVCRGIHVAEVNEFPCCSGTNTFDSFHFCHF